MPPLVPCLEKPGSIGRHPTVCVRVDRSIRRIVDIKTREQFDFKIVSRTGTSTQRMQVDVRLIGLHSLALRAGICSLVP